MHEEKNAPHKHAVKARLGIVSQPARKVSIVPETHEPLAPMPITYSAHARKGRGVTQLIELNCKS